MPIGLDEALSLEPDDTPEPTTMQSWLGRQSFIGRAGEALSRPTNLAMSALSAIPDAYNGRMSDAGDKIKQAVKGLPGLATGIVDLAGERVGAPSLQDYTDKAVGFDPEKDKTTGQDALKSLGVLKRSDNNLLSPAGLAGFGLEAVADPLHIPAVSKIVGAPLRKLGGLVSDLVPQGFKRGAAEAASGLAERAGDVVKKEGLTEEALRKQLQTVQAAGGDTSKIDSELSDITAKYGKPGSGREATLKAAEQKMGQNVGTGATQITPENERFMSQFHHSPQAVDVLNGLSDLMEQSGKGPLDLSKLSATGAGVNRLKHAIDQSGLRPEKINDLFEAVSGTRPLVEDTVTQARMRMFQHANAVSLNTFSDSLVKDGMAYKASIAPTDLHPTGKPDVKAFYTGPASRQFVVDGLVHNGAPLIFKTEEEATRASQVFSKIRPDTIGSVTPGEKLADIYDEVNRMYKYGVTQPFPQYSLMNKATNRMTANLVGDVPVVGPHYNMANEIIAGKGYDKVYKIGGKDVTGKDLINLFEQNGGSAVPNVNPSIGHVPEVPHNPPAGVLGKANLALQTVGKPFERVAAGMVGTMFNPTTMGPLAAKMQVTNKMLEESDRFGVFLHGVMKGMDPVAAIKRADMVLGNQSSAVLTPLERQVANKAVLFYNYTRNAIPAMAEAFTKKPGLFNLVLKADRQRKEQEPGYVRDGVSIDLPGAGNTLSNIPNPIENITKQFGAASPLGLLSPLPKLGVELATGQSTTTGQPLSPKAPNYLPEMMTMMGPTGKAQTALPGLTQLGVSSQNQNELLNNIPISRALSVANYAKKPETKWSDLALNIATGLKVNRFDPKSTGMYNEAEAYRATLDSYQKTGAVIKTQYGYQLNPQMLAKLPPDKAAEVAKAYGMYMKLSKSAGQLKKAADQRR